MFAREIPEIALLVEGAILLLEGFDPLPLPHYGEAIGRKTIILTQYAMVTGAILGTITAVASLTLANLAVTIAASVFTLYSLTASYFIRKVYHLKTIEQDVAQLQNTNKSMQETLDKYKKEILELNNSVDTIGKARLSLVETNETAVRANEELRKIVEKYEMENQEHAKIVKDLEQIPITIAEQLTSFEKDISRIQEGSKIINELAKNQLDPIKKGISLQVEIIKKSTQGTIQVKEFLNQCKDLLANITQLYQKTNEALMQTAAAEKAISEEFETWKIDELQRSQQQLAEILSKLDITLQDAFNELNKPKSQGMSASSSSVQTQEEEELRDMHSSLLKSIRTAREQIQLVIAP